MRRFARERIGAYRMLFVLRLAQWPQRTALRGALRRVPRDPRLIAFGASGSRFGDNTAYLYLHMSRHTDFRCVWVAASTPVVEQLLSLGLDAVRRRSLRGNWIAMRASWYVYSSFRSNVNRWLFHGSTAFNLWHGVGIKQIQRSANISAAGIYSAPEGSLAARIFADDRLSPDWGLSTSPLMSEKFAKDFGIAVEQCVKLGYPRNDHLATQSNPPPPLEDPTTDAQVRARRPVVGYFPTFRDNLLALPVEEPVLHEMADILESQGGTLLFKAHRSSVVQAESRGSLVVLPSEVDLNAYLGLCDVLITDYSSVAFDYLALNRPIILFCQDFETYGGKPRVRLRPGRDEPRRAVPRECRALRPVGRR